MVIKHVDIAIIGGSLGGVQAARSACADGKTVYMCEATDWIGGQLTNQAVPPDEHRWIESQGATKSYLDYRKTIRKIYQTDPNASELLKSKDRFCPGNSWVSRIAHDPRIAHRVLCESLEPYQQKGLLEIQLNSHCVEAQVQDDRILSVTIEDAKGEKTCVEAAFFLDATDCGDLLPLTGTAYRTGAESQEETGEIHALKPADHADLQPITWVAALEMHKERPFMEKPEGYDDFASRVVKGSPQLDWHMWGAGGLCLYAMFDNESAEKPLGLWSYRRIQYPPYFTDDRPEVTLLNWGQNDYVYGNIIDDAHAAEHLEEARQLTKACAYWLWQQGYPISLCPNILGTEDGLAKAPYIRESRRLVARKTIIENDIVQSLNETPRVFSDSIGVGHYAIDLHMTTRSRTTMYEPTQPFEIPLSAMIPVRTQNLIPACKNIGATHLTGGCFRLHPVEWTVGEAAGHLAAFCLDHHLPLQDMEGHWVQDFQEKLVENGFQLHWDFSDTEAS